MRKKINKKLKKGFGKMSSTLEKVTQKADEAVSKADEAKATAQEAKQLAEEVRATTSTKISEIREEVANQGKQILALLEQQPHAVKVQPFL